MTAALTASPQRVRLARLMVTTPGRLEFLAGLPEDDLRALHDQISEFYFAAGRDHFARVAGLSNLLPATVVGRLAERFLPPQLGARAAEQLDPAKARDLVDRVSLGYLTDLALALDPARAGRIIAALPAPRVAAVAGELFARGEHAMAAELAAAVPVEGLRAALGVAAGRDLLAVVPLLGWDDRMDAALACVSVRQLVEVLRELVSGRDWGAGDCLVRRLPPEGRRRLAAALVSAPDSVFAAITRASLGGQLGTATQELAAGAAAARAAAARAAAHGVRGS